MGGGGVSARAHSVDSVDSVARAGDWDYPIPFGSQAALPVFPTGCLPAWLEDEVHALAEEYQVALELPAMISLSVLSTCCAGRARVNVRGNWNEPLNLYVFVAAESGTRKSPVFADLTRPLIEGEKELATKIQAEQQETRALESRAKKQHDIATKKAAADNSAGSLADLIGLLKELEEIEVPPTPRVFAEDVTPEALISLLAEQKGRMSILSSEAGIFGIIAGRYSSQPNLDVFLKGYSGEPLRVDRKGRPPEYVPAATLTLGLCAQPSVIEDIARIPGARGRGLLARVLYALPAETRGWRQTITKSVSDEVSREYDKNICALLLTMAEWEDPMVLRLVPEALDLLHALMMKLEPKLRSDTGSLAGIADWASKYAGNVVRIAGLLHLAEHLDDPYVKPIDATTMRAAIHIGDFLLSHALTAFSLMNADPMVQKAKAILRWIDRQQCATFTVRDAHVGISRSVFRTADDLVIPLRLLEDHDYIRRLPDIDHPGPGRKPSPRYEVNPLTPATETTESTE